jgi:hypothetical protein
LKKRKLFRRPTKNWAEGIGLAIASFATVYSALSSGGFFSVKVSPDDMSKVINIRRNNYCC